MIQFADGHGDAVVQAGVNGDGDGVADFELLLHGAPTLVAAVVVF